LSLRVVATGPWCRFLCTPFPVEEEFLPDFSQSRFTLSSFPLRLDVWRAGGFGPFGVPSGGMRFLLTSWIKDDISTTTANLFSPFPQYTPCLSFPTIHRALGPREEKGTFFAEVGIFLLNLGLFEVPDGLIRVHLWPWIRFLSLPFRFL